MSGGHQRASLGCAERNGFLRIRETRGCVERGGHVKAQRPQNVRGGAKTETGAMWQDLNMACTSLPRCALDGPQGPENPAGNWVPFPKPWEPPLPHTAWGRTPSVANLSTPTSRAPTACCPVSP